MTGSLAGLKAVEFAAIGPCPFGAMMLADHGADVIRIDRLGAPPAIDPRFDVVGRSRRSIGLDLKTPEAVEIARSLVRRADIVLEGYRPGVMEKLGLGPEVLMADRPALVYGRMTGWGQEGPLSQAPGHDINYIAISGALGSFGRPDERPSAPLNLVADYGGGGMMLAFGVLAALRHAQATGEGQVVDCAMTDGVALMMGLMRGFLAEGSWRDERGGNLLDGGAPFYEVYETSDGRHVAIGAIEPQFFAGFRTLAGLDDEPLFDDRLDRARWPQQREALKALFRTRTRDEWAALLEDAGVCVSPVLSLCESAAHRQNAERGTFIERQDVLQPAPAPRFSRTPPSSSVALGSEQGASDAVMREAGYSADAIAAFRRMKVFGDGH